MIKPCSVTEAMKRTGLSKERLLTIAEKAEVEFDDNVPEIIVERIIQEQKNYISFREFAGNPRGERYDGTLYNRKKLLDTLELNDFYGIDVIDPEDLLIGHNHDVVFFRRKDISILEANLSDYFCVYAFSEAEKVEKMLAETRNQTTVKYIRQYINEYMFQKSITPVFTEFVSLVLSMPDLHKIKDSDVKKVVSKSMSIASKEHLIKFLNYARPILWNASYSSLSTKKKEVNSIPAYSDDTYISLARILFNAEYIDKHQMIERALQNHIYIEMWLYLCVHFCCAWRSADVCRGWRYLNLKDKADNEYGINAETLYEDILNNRIPEKVYEDVCKYAVGSIEVSGQMPAKTAGANTPPLVLTIAPELSTFFGLLTLISEAVMLRTGDGYMQLNRRSTYQSTRAYSKFFGQEMYDALHGRNIQSRRLNKDYLQGIEETARQTGCGSLMASALASFARSHNNLDTIICYVRDHTINSENAHMVLYYMMERGVFGVELYRTLLIAYPESMKKLPMKQQNEIMMEIMTTPLQIELEQSGVATMLDIKDKFIAGKDDAVLKLLKAMFEITQGRGLAKDEGIHCTLRARGLVCPHPEYASCLANACPYLVFTRYGYKALLAVVAEYNQAANAGNAKMDAVLKNVIKPRFHHIINALMREEGMCREDKAGLQLMLEETINDGI